MKKQIIRGIWITMALVLAYGAFYGYQMLGIATAYAAKISCSCRYVSERPLSSILAEDMAGFSFLSFSLDDQEKSAAVSFYGMFEQVARFREGKGCTLVNGLTEAELMAQGSLVLPLRPAALDTVYWPSGDKVILPDSILSAQKVQKIREVVANNLQNTEAPPLGTRALLVLYDNHLLSEQYASGISSSTRLTGWSMTKSVMQALVGLLVAEGKLSLSESPVLEEWAAPDDPRSAINLDHLLRMSSGLAFEEQYDRASAANKMLWRKPAAGVYAAQFPLAHPIDQKWYYSSGTSNIISLKVYRTLAVNAQDPLQFPYQSLFSRIGMYSPIIEPDPSGVWVGSSLMYANARDWARFGLLYLNKGNWQGEQILPENWASYAATPTPDAPLGQYGAHFWLNAGDDGQAHRPFPSLPTDLYYCSGFEGQYVFIIPSAKLVVVRLGLTQGANNWDIEGFISEILAVLQNS